MSISRRNLLRNGGLLSAAAAFSALLPLKLRALTGSSAPGLSLSLFQSLINTHFKVVSTNQKQPAVYLTLTQANQIQSGPKSSEACAGYILQFWGGNFGELKQDLYTITSLKDTALPPFNLLLVPGIKHAREYHAVIFNLVK